MAVGELMVLLALWLTVATMLIPELEALTEALQRMM
jgi:hypothetical protein